MSFSRYSEDCLALILKKDYFEKFLNDIRTLSADDIDDEEQRDLFENYDAENFEGLTANEVDYYDIDDDIKRVSSGSVNYASAAQVDIETGKTVSGFHSFDGYIYPISYGSGGLYEPEFKNKEELLKEIKRSLYIPRGYNIEENIVQYTGVDEG